MFRSILSIAVLVFQVMHASIVCAEPKTLSVSGRATLLVQPDFVTLTFVVQRNADLAVVANQEVSKVMSSLLQVASEWKINDADLRTNSITIRGNRIIGNDCTPPRIVASQTLTLVLRKLDKVEEIVDEMIEQGALITGGAAPGIDNRDEYGKKALRLAIENARDQANAAATQLGFSLGEVSNISFSTQGDRQRLLSYSRASSTGTNYRPGPIPISQSISVSFESADN